MASEIFANFAHFTELHIFPNFPHIKLRILTCQVMNLIDDPIDFEETRLCWGGSLDRLDKVGGFSYNRGMDLTQHVKDTALSLGFDAVGITHAGAVGPRDRERFARWLEAGHQAGMGYMARDADKRMDPGLLLEGARSIVCVGLNYNPPDVGATTSAGPVGRVTDFALYDDYHDFIRVRLKRLAAAMRKLVSPQSCEFKVCVDSVPLAERAIAQRAGLGFLSVNHCLIHPVFGCMILLGELITTVELEPDEPMDRPCLGCQKCIRACPTGALGRDGSFDAGKCISYLTIEHKAQIVPEMANKIGDRLFGCDACIRCCPHQLNVPVAANPDFQFYPERRTICLREMLNWTEADFNRAFGGSVVFRIGLERLGRNARICLANQRR